MLDRNLLTLWEERVVTSDSEYMYVNASLYICVIFRSNIQKV